MKARLLIEGATFTPNALKVVQDAFDAAWAEIAANIGSDPKEIEAARLKLAEAVLSVADEDSREVEPLKNGALRALSLDYRVNRKPLLPES